LYSHIDYLKTVVGRIIDLAVSTTTRFLFLLISPTVGFPDIFLVSGYWKGEAFTDEVIK
jgi:hypothetical protein